MKHDEYDWKDAREKIRTEGACRYCHVTSREAKLEAAHTIGRKVQDEIHTVPDYIWETGMPKPPEKVVRRVNPDAVIPLCSSWGAGNGCHQKYDAHKLDILDVLTEDEQANAVAAVGIARAIRRLTSGMFELREKEVA